jgi:hypothetical protein
MNHFKYALFLLLLVSSCKKEEKQKIESPVSKETGSDFTIAFGTCNNQNAVTMEIRGENTAVYETYTQSYGQHN